MSFVRATSNLAVRTQNIIICSGYSRVTLDRSPVVVAVNFAVATMLLATISLVSLWITTGLNVVSDSPNLVIGKIRT